MFQLARPASPPRLAPLAGPAPAGRTRTGRTRTGRPRTGRTLGGRRAGLLAVGAGGAAALALVGWAGAGAIAEAVLRAGWILPPILALHAVQLALSGVAWRAVSGGGGP